MCNDKRNTFMDGLATAWELARKVACVKSDCFSQNVLHEIFGTTDIEYIFEHFSPKDAYEKVEAYRAFLNIHPGRVVFLKDGTRGVVMEETEDSIQIFTEKGRVIEKTGKRGLHDAGYSIDLSGILNQIMGVTLPPKKAILKDFAKKMNGKERQCPQFTRETVQFAKENGFLILFGTADGIIKLNGVLYDEIHAPDTRKIYLDKKGFLEGKESENVVDIVAYSKKDSNNAHISLAFETKIPHESFMIYDNGDLFCEAIVFRMSDITE